MEPFIERSHTGESLPLVASIPHAGTHLPDAVLGRLASDAMRELPLTDWHVHELYDFLPDLGITVIHATWSRFYSDLNRHPDPEETHGGPFESGIIALETEHGEVVWAEPPDEAQMADWREHVYEPYHRRLTELLREMRTNFGRAVLIDLHSVPSYENTDLATLEDDVYLGNRNGRSCGPWLMDTAHDALAAEGLRVARNGLYQGGYITKHYAQIIGIETLQVELVQRVYMDEDDPGGALDSRQFAHAKTRLARAFEKIAGAVRKEITS